MKIPRNLEDLLDIKVEPNKTKISLWEKYPNSTFVFEYNDGTSSRIDHDFQHCLTTDKGARSLIDNLPDRSKGKKTVEYYDKYLLCQKDLTILQTLENYIVRAWVIPYHGKV